MKIKSSKNRIIRRTVALAMVLCLLVSCSSNNKIGVTVTKNVSSRNVISYPAKDPASVHYAQSSGSYSESVASSGLIELRVDRETASFGVYDSSGDILWSALPLLDDLMTDPDESCSASMVALKIAGGTDVYNLNSQDNSLAYNTAYTDTVENGVKFTYDIFDSAETAKAKTPAETSIGFRVELSVKLEDGNMNVSCTYKNLTGNKNACIEQIELLNYFGAYNTMAEDNFILVPDGCGAMLKTSVYDESFEPLSFAVYGDDLSTGAESSGSAIVPVFGVKKDNGAFVAIIEKGDAVASVKAEKAMSFAEYNRTYSTYDITPAQFSDNTLYVSDTVSTDEIKICYRFLSGKNATYSGMASSAREQFIRSGVLSSKTVETTDYIPFFVTFNGSKKEKLLGFEYISALTDFEQAEDMLIRMKNKGINNINVRYCSIFSGGYDQKDISDSKILSKLGGTKKLEELYNYMSSQKMKLYLDIDILSSSEKISSGNAENIFGESTSYTPSYDMYSSLGTTIKTRFLRNISNLKDVISDILSDTKNYTFNGYCINDAGKILYSDFSEKGILRQDASDIISSTVSPLATSKSVMVSGGNIYMLKNADAVVDLPLTTTVSKSGAYIPIPFVQLILHGLADYTGSPINSTDNSGETMLKYIEYGACPYYEWNYISVSDDEDNYYYDNTINSAAEFYEKATETLNDLRDARITDHYEADDGVFCTEYDTGTMIYVNYTDSEYSVLGLTVEPGDFLRIN